MLHFYRLDRVLDTLGVRLARKMSDHHITYRFKQFTKLSHPCYGKLDKQLDKFYRHVDFILLTSVIVT